MPADTELALLVKAQNEASKVLKDVHSDLSGFGKSLTDVSKIAGGFVLGQGIIQAPAFLISAAKSAADDAASMARLKTAAENTGESFDDLSEDIDYMITAGQRLGFTDDQTRDSLSLLMAQTGDAEEAFKRYTLAQDLARGANIDVVTASRLLGKVTDENVNVLARYGIKVEKGASETELFSAIFQKFHGQAQTFADSTAGKMARLQDRMGELKETIGYALLPVMSGLAYLLLTYVVPAIETLISKAGPIFSMVFSRAGEVVKSILPILQTFRQYIGAVLEDGDTLNDWLSNLPVPIQGVAKAIGELVLWIKDSFIPALQTIAGQVIALVSGIVSWAVESGLLSAALAGVQTITQGLALAWQALLPPLKAAINFIVENKIAAYALVAAFAAVTVSLAPIPVAIGATIIAIGYLSQNWDSIRVKTLEVWQAIASFVDEKLGFLVTIVRVQTQAVWSIIDLHINLIRSVIGIALDLIHGRWGEAWAGIGQLTRDLFNDIKAIIHAHIDPIVAIFKSLGDLIVDALKPLPGRLLDLGKQAGQAIIDGIKSIPGVGEALKIGEKVGGALVGGLRAALGSHSPSKEAQEAAQSIIDGLNDVLMRSLPNVSNMGKALAEAFINGWNSAGALPSSKGGARASIGAILAYTVIGVDGFMDLIIRDLDRWERMGRTLAEAFVRGFKEILPGQINGIVGNLGTRAGGMVNSVGMGGSANTLAAVGGAGATNINVIINGPIYGFEDFKRQAQEAIADGIRQGKFGGGLQLT